VRESVSVLSFLLLLSLSFDCKHFTDLPPLPEYDTTSHGFIWQVDSVGEGPSDVLRDVVILNDTLAYAVGELYLRDSTGQLDPQPYNFARWNGSDWKLSRSTNVGLRAVFAFGPNDVWVGTSSPYHWDGNRWAEYTVTGVFNGYINRFWGTSSGDLHMVGTNGSIAHWNGSSWLPLASGTTLDIGDVYGATDSGGVEVQILAVAGNPNISGDRKILQVSRLDVTDLSSSGISGPLSGVWLIPNTLYYVVGNEIYKKNLLSNSH